MDPSGSVINIAQTAQLVGMGILAIMLIGTGLSIATGGARGFAGAIASIAGLIIAFWMVARPNDAASLILGFLGGFQPVSLPQ
jgi:hypothetical protein